MISEDLIEKKRRSLFALRKRNAQIHIQVSGDFKEWTKEIANILGLDLTEFLVKAIISKGLEVVGETTQLRKP